MNLYSNAIQKWHVRALFSGAHSLRKNKKVKTRGSPLMSQKMFFQTLAYYASL